MGLAVDAELRPLNLDSDHLGTKLAGHGRHVPSCGADRRNAGIRHPFPGVPVASPAVGYARSGCRGKGETGRRPPWHDEGRIDRSRGSPQWNIANSEVRGSGFRCCPSAPRRSAGGGHRLVGQHAGRRGPSDGRSGPRRRDRLLRHGRHLLGRARGGDPRTSRRRPSRPGADRHEGEVHAPDRAPTMSGVRAPTSPARWRRAFAASTPTTSTSSGSTASTR